ncbi:polysaccharide deacetylase family protein [Actinomadura madurae]|uniref:polysaccharide deacetylase family protein n=1 Tax=Actinomadura madurae TaxID=1993 RepID=UPI000D953D33|nr:polysaccharide deacetylase family protein [Actinomadura madurae]SPT50308.1 Bifunctional xylanase/deacetylase precursor [Actinomadura madurae]
MRIRIFAVIGVGVLLAAGCGHPERHVRPSGQRAAPGSGGRPERSPSAAAAPPRTPPPPRRIDCDRVKCAALTFDDGPGPYTARLLDTLERTRTRATFFLLGQNVRDHRHLVRRMALEGHELGNHTWSHPDLTDRSAAEVRSQIRRTQRAVEDASGVRPTLVRPPYGSTNHRVGEAVGMPLILWSVDTLDWRHRDRARDVRIGVAKPKRGGIVLYHDTHRPSVESIPAVIAGLRERGFTLVTVTELFGGRDLEPGESYTERTERTEPPAEVVATHSPAAKR